MNRGEGERLHARRQRKFWLTLAALAGVGGLCGFIAGFVKGFADGGNKAVEPWLLQLGVAGVVLGAVLAAYFSWRFFATVDEVEVADNLWGSLIGFYVYAILLPSWWALDKLTVAPPPDHWLIYGLSMITAVAVYAYRKWRMR